MKRNIIEIWKKTTDALIIAFLIVCAFAIGIAVGHTECYNQHKKKIELGYFFSAEEIQNAQNRYDAYHKKFGIQE